jgi:hypothetical protein
MGGERERERQRYRETERQRDKSMSERVREEWSIAWPPLVGPNQ